jgi:multidrug efflux pump subunit AcrA (membrane-fusion protein)
VKNRRWLWLLGIIAAALVVLAAVRIWNRDIVPVKVAVAGRGPIEAIVSASGTVNAPVYDLGAKLGGKIVKLLVREGELVRAGQELAEFDDTTRIIAPDRGIVAKINYRTGETVVPGGEPAIIVINYEQSWAEAQIDEIDIGSVKIGDRVRITSDDYPDKVFDGEIYWIAPLAELRKVGGRVKIDEESYVFPCKIRFLGGHKELMVNMSINADIISERKDNVLLVPREALVSQGDYQTVFKIKGNRSLQGKITIGLRSAASVEALTGIDDGDLLAISNVAKLKDRGRAKIER